MDKTILQNKIDELDRSTWHLQYDGNDEINDIFFKLIDEANQVTPDQFEEFLKKIEDIEEAIQYKYGYMYTLTKRIPDALDLTQKLDSIKLNGDVKKDVEGFKLALMNKVNNLDNYDFLINPFEDRMSQDNLKLALDSIKNILENPRYQSKFPNRNKIDFLIDYIKLSENTNNSRIEIEFKKLEKEYKDSIDEIWKEELSNSYNENGEFKLLVSMISSPKNSSSVQEQVDRLLNRPEQHSCSLISNNFIGTYCNTTTKIGLIYPNDSNIISCGYRDLNSNVFGNGMINKEASTTLVTPKALLDNTVSIAKSRGEDLLNSPTYNEVLVDSNTKPCGVIALITKNHELLKDDLIQARILSRNLGLPLTVIDTMQKENELQANEIQENQFQETGISR